MVTRWLVAAASLALGATVTGTLLWFGNPSRGAVEVAVAAHDVAAETQLGDAIVLEDVPATNTAALFTRHDASALASLYATHALTAGQLIQRSDVGPPPQDSRLVFLPVKDMPAVAPGSRVDLLVVEADASVQPFASNVEVSGATSGGLVVDVGSRQAAAFVYAATAMHLVAVVAEPGSASGSEVPVASADQAMQIAAQP